LQGITDPEDPLRIDALMPDGPEQYIAWFRQLSDRRRVG
jgi:glucosylglycerol 3-phosphatase